MDSVCVINPTIDNICVVYPKSIFGLIYKRCKSYFVDKFHNILKSVNDTKQYYRHSLALIVHDLLFFNPTT